MTDIDKLESLLKEFGAGYKREGDMISCSSEQAKNEGYGGFWTDFTFDSEGNFVRMGAWE